MSVRKGQERLKDIAVQISEDIQLSPEDKKFLVTALLEIYNGEDAEVSLGVKAKRGERKSTHVRDMKIINQYINGLIKALISPYDEGGKNMSLKDATDKIHAEWPYSPSAETMRRHWNDYRKRQERDFIINTVETD